MEEQTQQVRRHRRQRDDSDNESDIPLAELQIRLRRQKLEGNAPTAVVSSYETADESQTESCSPRMETGPSTVTARYSTMGDGYGPGREDSDDYVSNRPICMVRRKKVRKINKKKGNRNKELKLSVGLIDDML